MKTLNRVLFIAVVFLRFLTEELHGQATIFQHFGAVDPTSEGFTLLQSGSPTLNPVMGDMGLDAWSIKLNGHGDIAQYSQKLTPQQQASAAAGWTLSLTVRILQPFHEPSLFGSFRAGPQSYTLLLGAQPNGDPLVRLGNSQFNLTGGGSGYHNYQLRYDGAVGAASLWVDGVEALTGLIGGSGGGQARFSWGGGQNPFGTLSANWNEVSLTIIPEPSSLTLCLTGGILAISRFIRQRKI